MEIPAKPDAMPVAIGLTVEPRQPIPAPIKTTAKPVTASNPAAMNMGIIST